MKRQALAAALGLLALPALAEPYRPLPRHPPQKVRERAATARILQGLRAPAASSQEELTVRAAPSEPPAAAPFSKAEVSPAELKVSMGQGSDGSHFVMLIEDPSGARIELTLDDGGRLLAVRPAPSRSAESAEVTGR